MLPYSERTAIDGYIRHAGYAERERENRYVDLFHLQRDLFLRYTACLGVMAPSLISAILMLPYSSLHRQPSREEPFFKPTLNASRSCFG